MPDDTTAAGDVAAHAKRTAKAAVADAVERGHDGLNDAIELAERNIRDAARRIDKAVREGVDQIRVQTGPYREQAGQQIDEASKYIVDRVKERPVTATVAGVAIGLLLGLLLASRSSK